MKKFLSLLALATLLVSGCAYLKSQSNQTIAFNSIATIEKTTTAAYDGYTLLVIHGSIKTNDVPKVSHDFNDFQSAALLATDAVQGNTNALAPSSLVIESQDLVNLISTIEKGL